MKSVLRPLPDNASGRSRLTVCINDRGPNAITVSCGPQGGTGLDTAIADEIERRGIDIEVQTIKCLGLCEKGPNVRLAPGNNWFHEITPSDVPALVEAAAGHMGLLD